MQCINFENKAELVKRIEKGRLKLNIMKNNYFFKTFIALFITVNVMAQNVPNYVPTNGLVGWWPFNGNANDESGNGNHGTVNGATLTADRDGKANSAYDFDGVTAFIDLNNTENLILNNGLTFSAWVNSRDIRMASIIDKETFATEGYGYRLNIRSDSSIWAEHGAYGEGKIGANTAAAENSYEVNDWVHVVGVLDLSNGRNILYIDNKLLDIKSINLLISNFKKIQIGKSTLEQGEYFNGIIDDIAIYNRALSDQEVKQLYEGCTKETATSSNFNSYVFTDNSPVNLSATPTGGAFSGEAVTNNSFEPSKAKLGKNQVKYNFKNSTGCADSTNFTMILVDTLGNKCTETIYDTIKVKESTYDTLKIKVQLTTGIKAGQLTSMNVYPNPTSDVIIVDASDVAALNGYSYKLIDVQGKEVYNALVTTTKTEISMKTFGKAGLYILYVVDANNVSIETKQIVLE